jgi:predicted acetyltransferase
LTPRLYDPEKDRNAVHRIWLEVGWLEPGHEDRMDAYIEGSQAWVADVNGQAECLVLTDPGSMLYLDEDLPISFLTGVTTSWVARKQGLAKRLAARAIAADAEAGLLVSALGMFEQGFYDQLGYGSGGYEHRLSFDPADLNVSARHRAPSRFDVQDVEAIHAGRLKRRRTHGGCNLQDSKATKIDLDDTRTRFVLGYRDAATGEITHHICFGAKEIEKGPYRIGWIAFQTREHFLELMSVVRSLGDQVRIVTMEEPPGIQLQDLIREPLKHRTISAKSTFEGNNAALAYWQMRILDLPTCLTRTHIDTNPIRFNLSLSDPIERYLDDNPAWRGIGGEYIVTLGPESSSERGHATDLPTLGASVGAFTRLWLGVRPATGLAITDDLTGPDELLRKLDRALRLPEARPDWEF